MRGVVTGIFIILAVFHSEITFASSDPKHEIGIEDVEVMLSLKSTLEGNHVALEKINKVLAHLERRQDKYRSEDDFVEYLYYYTHRRLLKNYIEYPTLEETLISGNYDCLTATAIYSILLSELAIDHAVVETNYHIYIIINPDTEEELLFETTDPRYGFIDDQDEISASKRSYLSDNSTARNTLISFDYNIQRRLENKELIGLLYYNQSIKEVNNGDWEKALEIAKKAFEYYSETRVSTLINIIDSASL